jgi:hypothetical protein
MTNFGFLLGCADFVPALPNAPQRCASSAHSGNLIYSSERDPEGSISLWKCMCAPSCREANEIDEGVSLVSAMREKGGRMCCLLFHFVVHKLLGVVYAKKIIANAYSDETQYTSILVSIWKLPFPNVKLLKEILSFTFFRLSAQ